MSRQEQSQFEPDYAVPPGETLQDTLDALGMSQAELAERTGRTTKTINEIIKGKAPITPETALQLEKVLRVPASFWNNLERNYRETLARLSEQERLLAKVEWLQKIPVRDMVKKGWIRPCKDKVEQLEEVLGFFGIASPDQWEATQACFRESPAFQSKPGAVAAWLRKGELTAQEMPCAPFDAPRFRKVLQLVRGLTVQPPEAFQPQMIGLCAEAGVAVGFVPELPGLRLSGATWWLNARKAIIQLSLRHKSDDQLWFSFFHEAGHILMHGKTEAFIEDDLDGGKEAEANQFAADFLIPARKYAALARVKPLSKETIQGFADEIGIAPGIVVGRLQHDGYLPFTHCNDLKRRFQWAEA